MQRHKCMSVSQLCFCTFISRRLGELCLHGFLSSTCNINTYSSQRNRSYCHVYRTSLTSYFVSTKIAPSCHGIMNPRVTNRLRFPLWWHEMKNVKIREKKGRKKNVCEKPLSCIFNATAKLVSRSPSNRALWEGAVCRSWETKFTSVSGMLILSVRAPYKSYT